MSENYGSSPLVSARVSIDTYRTLREYVDRVLPRPIYRVTMRRELYDVITTSAQAAHRRRMKRPQRRGWRAR